MLKLDAQHKAMMRKNGALAKDDAGQDVLRGLTLTESMFVLDSEAGTLAEVGLLEVMVYNQLIVRHTAAKVIHTASQPRP